MGNPSGEYCEVDAEIRYEIGRSSDNLLTNFQCDIGVCYYQNIQGRYPNKKGEENMISMDTI